MKGIKGTSYAKESFDIIGGMTIKDYLESNVVSIVAISSVFWSLLSYIFITVIKADIYKIIIAVGTFALALAFAGNDLVNFIGVPIAAWQSYEAWGASGLAANEFSMQVLASKVPTPNYLLFALKRCPNHQACVGESRSSIYTKESHYAHASI